MSEDESLSIGDVLGSGRFERSVRAVIATWVVGAIFTLRDQIVELVLDMQSSTFGAIEDAGGAVAESIAVIGGVPLSVMSALESVIIPIAESAGPFAPFVVIGMWILYGIVLAALIRILIWLLPLVIPWL